MPDFLAVFEWGAKTVRDTFLRPVIGAAGSLLSTPVPFVMCDGCGSPYGHGVSTPCYVCQLQEREAEEDVAEPLSPCHCSSLGGECIWCEDVTEARGIQERLDRNPQTKAMLDEAEAGMLAGDFHILHVNKKYTWNCACCDKESTAESAAVSQIVQGSFCSTRCVSVAEARQFLADQRIAPQSPAQPVAASGAVEGPRRGCPPSPSGVPTKYTVSERGFRHFTPVETTYGHTVKVYESSAASAPYVWLRIEGDATDPPLSAHCSVEQASAIRDQLTAFIDDAALREAQ